MTNAAVRPVTLSMLAPFSTTQRLLETGGRKANPAGLRIPKARSLPAKKSCGALPLDEEGRGQLHAGDERRRGEEQASRTSA